MIVVSWMVEVAEEFRLQQETLHASVSLPQQKRRECGLAGTTAADSLFLVPSTHVFASVAECWVAQHSGVKTRVGWWGETAACPCVAGCI